MSPIESQFDSAVNYWKTLSSDPNAHYDKEIHLNAAEIAPTVTWGTSPQDVITITGVVVFCFHFC
jgi:homoaconitase/3-isopropylmalate dehydratase large subunit